MPVHHRSSCLSSPGTSFPRVPFQSNLLFFCGISGSNAEPIFVLQFIAHESCLGCNGNVGNICRVHNIRRDKFRMIVPRFCTFFFKQTTTRKLLQSCSNQTPDAICSVPWQNIANSNLFSFLLLSSSCSFSLVRSYIKKIKKNTFYEWYCWWQLCFLLVPWVYLSLDVKVNVVIYKGSALASASQCQWRRTPRSRLSQNQLHVTTAKKNLDHRKKIDCRVTMDVQVTFVFQKRIVLCFTAAFCLCARQKKVGNIMFCTLNLEATNSPGS